MKAHESTAARAGSPRPLVIAMAVAGFLVLRLLPPPAGLGPDGWAVAALALLMATLWLTEALPLSMTATLPFLLLPVMGVMKPDEIAGLYWSPTIFLVLGGAIVAIALEQRGLHRRLALGIARMAPDSPAGLLLALMAATAITSMLVSNTASALIMMPVALAMARSIGAEGSAQAGGHSGLTTLLVLGVAYAATIGGFGTLVGSPTNAIATGIIERSLDLRIDFLTWAMFGLPLVILAVPLAAGLLLLMFRPAPGTRLPRIGPATRLPAMGKDEKHVLAVVSALVLAWIFTPLAGPALGLPRIDDGMIAIAAALLLLAMPASGGGPLLPWHALKQVPWDILLMFGGGLALAGAISQSGLAAWLGAGLSGLSALPAWGLAALMIAAIILVTEFASNVATASGFVPVVAAVILATGADPLFFAMCAALASSWGFMMPAGTGPNAIAYATGEVSVRQMVRTGFILNLAGIPLLVAICALVAKMI